MAGIEGEKPAKSGIYWSCLVSFDAVDLPRAFYRPFQCIRPLPFNSVPCFPTHFDVFIKIFIQ